MKIKVNSIDYNNASDALKYEIAKLLYKVWPDGDKLDLNIHKKELNVYSFCLYGNNQLIGYVGVVRKEILKNNQTFNLVGLSSVAIDPNYQRKGFGKKLVAIATNWIENQKDIDIGIFTCDPSLASFYYEAGSWTVVSDVILIGNDEKDALSSEDLEVNVLMRLFSKKACQHEKIIRHSTINLQFPKDEFL